MGRQRDQMDDDALMIRCAEGDEDAFRILVERWQQPVYAFLARMLGSPEDAEDLCQDTFLKVHEQAARYRPAGRFKSWLFRVAGNAARSQLRRRKVLRWLRYDPERHDAPDPGPAPDRALAAAQNREAVREAIAALPWRQRQAVVLRRHHDLSYREIADALGTTIPAVESLLQRAAAALQERLAGKVDLP